MGAIRKIAIGFFRHIASHAAGVGVVSGPVLGIGWVRLCVQLHHRLTRAASVLRVSSKQHFRVPLQEGITTKLAHMDTHPPIHFYSKLLSQRFSAASRRMMC